MAKPPTPSRTTPKPAAAAAQPAAAQPAAATSTAPVINTVTLSPEEIAAAAAPATPEPAEETIKVALPTQVTSIGSFVEDAPMMDAAGPALDEPAASPAPIMTADLPVDPTTLPESTRAEMEMGSRKLEQHQVTIEVVKGRPETVTLSARTLAEMEVGKKRTQFWDEVQAKRAAAENGE